MKKFFFLALLSVLFLAVACPKHDTSPKPDELPPMTQTGANTFGCMLNGKVWLPNWGGGHWPVDAQYYRGVFSIGTSKVIRNTAGEETTGQSIGWKMQLSDTGKYFLKNSADLIIHYSDYVNKLEYDSLDQTQAVENWIYINKLDTSNSVRVISGTFNFALKSPGLDNLHITDGRFDVKYTY